MMTWPPSGLSKAQQEAIESAGNLVDGVRLLRAALPNLATQGGDRAFLVRQAMEAGAKARAKAKGRWK